MREAIREYTRGLDLKSPVAETNHKLLTARAKCQIGLENYGYAIADLERAIGIKPVPEL